MCDLIWQVMLRSSKLLLLLLLQLLQLLCYRVGWCRACSWPTVRRFVSRRPLNRLTTLNCITCLHVSSSSSVVVAVALVENVIRTNKVYDFCYCYDYITPVVANVNVAVIITIF